MSDTNTPSMEQRINAAIDARRFNFFEIRGFQSQPRLALIAGAAIGYRMAVEDFERNLNKTRTTDADSKKEGA